MRRQLFGTLVMLGLAVPATPAFAPLAPQFTIQSESRVWVEGTSTVRNYQCTAGEVDGTVTADAKPSTAIQDLERSVHGVDLTIPVAALECGNGTMNSHMRKALKQDQHPKIRYRLTAHEVTPQANGTGAVRMTGKLSIAGKENPVTINATAVQEAGGALRVKGSKEFRMTEYGVKPPTLMMGTLKVHDPVVVHFDMLLKP